MLDEIGAGGIDRTLVFNKTDLVEDRQMLFQAAEAWTDAVFSSAAEGSRGLKHLRDRIISLIEAGESEFSIELAPKEGSLAAAFHRMGRVLERRMEDGKLLLRVRMPWPLAMQIVKDTPYENQLIRGRTS